MAVKGCAKTLPDSKQDDHYAEPGSISEEIRHRSDPISGSNEASPNAGIGGTERSNLTNPEDPKVKTFNEMAADLLPDIYQMRDGQTTPNIPTYVPPLPEATSSLVATSGLSAQKPTNTYACTYRDCTLRFDTLQKLQEHERDEEARRFLDLPQIPSFASDSLEDFNNKIILPSTVTNSGYASTPQYNDLPQIPFLVPEEPIDAYNRVIGPSTDSGYTSTRQYNDLPQIPSFVPEEPIDGNNRITGSFTDSCASPHQYLPQAVKLVPDGIDVNDKIAGPFTDSGYASTRQDRKGSVQRDILPYEEDGATIYTQESDLNSTTKNSYIGEFAKLLFDDVHKKHATVEITGKILNSIEELLRSFALRMAHGNSDPEVIRLAAFIHRHRRNIGENFKNLDSENIDSPVSSPSVTDGMSYLEKISAWAIDDPAEMEAPGIPEELEIDRGSDFGDLDHEEELMPEIMIYRRLIEDSGAYMWLRAQLSSRTPLSISGIDIRGKIRNDILGALPEAPRISRTRRQPLITAVYNVQWDLLGFLKEQQYKEEHGYAFENAITLTGGEGEMQAETCMGYMQQTWPLMGECLIRILKHAIQSAEGTQHTSNAVDGTVLTASIQSSTVIVTTSGSRDSIADIGEQLAWLGSSLRSSPVGKGPVFCYAETHRLISRVDSKTSLAPSVELQCTIRFKTKRPDDQTPSGMMNGKCWHNLFRNPMVAMGFPIAMRDEPQAGLEIPLPMMATLAQAKRVTVFDGRIFVKGYSTMLVPTKQVGNTVLWHLLYNERGERLPYTDPRIDQLQDSSVADLGIAEISRARHVLGWASSTEIVAGTSEANYGIRRSGYNSRVPGCVLEKVSLSAGKVINVGTSFVVGVREVPLHLKREGSYVDQIQDAYNNYVILYDVDEKRAWMMNGATALLHIVRASLHDTLTGKFGSHSLYEAKKLQDSSVQYTSDSAIDVLTCRSNMELAIARDKDEIWTEITKNEDGSEHKVTKRKEKFVYFQDVVDQKWHILEQILDQQSKRITQGVKLGMPGRQYLEGFDFTDVATRIQDLPSKATALQSRGKAWVDFTRSIGAITLFGRGFGELIRPAQDSNNVCPHWKTLPKHMDYLAVSVSDLEEICKRRGDPDASPMRLVDDIYWHKPDKLVEACHCSGKKLKRTFCGLNSLCDRVQVLMPLTSRMSRLISPGSLDCIRQGAVIFGHSRTFSLRWKDHGDPEEGEISPPPEEPRSSFNDSGLGSSLTSSSEERGSSKREKRSLS
jgi:hypothetical protein